jgi:hypothetical protein
MKINMLLTISLVGIFQFFNIVSFAQKPGITRDSVIYHLIYRDTIIYKHDTVKIRHYVYTDTLPEAPNTSASAAVETRKRKRLINPNSWGIGPSIGAYYSPFNGYDVNIGFGIQYYFLAIPTFRNPHMKHARSGK